MTVNYDFQKTDKYLTEDLLGDFLKDFLPGLEIVHDKKVPNSNIINRPDYRIEELKLIIEFNGKFHYTSPKAILNDYKKRYVYQKMGYSVKVIPYWIQLTNTVIFHLFDEVVKLDLDKIENFTTYSHGFISKDCPLPSTFCELGTKELIKEKSEWEIIIENFYYYFDYTLLKKIFEKDSFLEVANETTLPYFVDSWRKRKLFNWNIKVEEFPNINKEINLIEELRAY